MREWQAADAARQLGKIMTHALTEGPQRIRCGEGTVIMLSEVEYERLIGRRLTLRSTF